jgi:hypothetical protein
MGALVGHFPCGVTWGIHKEHPRVHTCELKIPIRYADEGPGFESQPHEGEHRCRCGERRTVGMAPGRR